MSTLAHHHVKTVSNHPFEWKNYGFKLLNVFASLRFIFIYRSSMDFIFQHHFLPLRTYSVNRIGNKENRKHLLPFIVFKRNGTCECVRSMFVFLSLFFSLSLSPAPALDIVCINNANRHACNSISNAALKSRSNRNEFVQCTTNSFHALINYNVLLYSIIA